MVDAAIDCYGPQKWNNDNKRNFRSNYIQLPLIINEPYKHDMPLDMQKALADSKGCFTIVYLGRIDPVKLNHSELPLLTLIEAAYHFKIKNYHFKILYIGDGDSLLTERMKVMVNEKELDSCVKFLGFKANVNEYICHADIGIGGIALNTVCQEFATYHIPQILVDNHENFETPWKDKETTLFIKPNDLQSLIETIEYAMNNKTELRNIAENAYIMTRQYINEPKAGGRKFISAYNQILENKTE